MCRNAEATTGEHKWPAAYLRRIPEPWSELQHGTWEGDRFHTQGVRSRNLTMPVLCAHCNNAVSRSQDRSLDAFLLMMEDRQGEAIRNEVVHVSHAADKHDPLDLYRALLKLEFSRLYDDGVAVPAVVANFVSGGDDWRAANALVRVHFRITLNMLEMGLSYPSESDAPFYENPYFITHQINFGWLGIHYTFAPDERPDLPWPEWSLELASLVPCVSYGATIDPPY